jgi:hypothetical protein
VAPWAAATVKTQCSEGKREQTRRARLTYALWNSRLSPPLTHTNSSKRTSSPYWLRWFVQRWGPALDRGAHACFPKELRRRKVAASSRFGRVWHREPWSLWYPCCDCKHVRQTQSFTPTTAMAPPAKKPSKPVFKTSSPFTETKWSVSPSQTLLCPSTHPSTC